MKKIYILSSNPVRESMTRSVADSYERGALESGFEVRKTEVHDLDFDPVLHNGYKVIQELEKDLVQLQEDIKWADHIVVVYPNWWATMPAKLKGVFDRAFLPGFAFRFNKETDKSEGLLKGRTARVLNICGTNSPMSLRIKMGDCTNELKKGILRFSGIKDVKVTQYGPTRNQKPEILEKFLQSAYRLGKRGL